MNRLRIVAGPNGSGKSTIITQFQEKRYFNAPFYLNADDVLKKLFNGEFQTPIKDLTAENLLMFSEKSTYADSYKEILYAEKMECIDGILKVDRSALNSYTIAMLTDALAHVLLERKINFIWETVFSHESKLHFMKQAKASGWKNYLYFVSTQDVKMNIERVGQRVKMGGHDVPLEKMEPRYKRTMSFLKLAIQACHRAYIFDNSSFVEPRLYAEYTPAGDLKMYAEEVPEWIATYLLSDFPGKILPAF